MKKRILVLALLFFALAVHLPAASGDSAKEVTKEVTGKLSDIRVSVLPQSLIDNTVVTFVFTDKIITVWDIQGLLFGVPFEIGGTYTIKYHTDTGRLMSYSKQ